MIEILQNTTEVIHLSANSLRINYNFKKKNEREWTYFILNDKIRINKRKESFIVTNDIFTCYLSAFIVYILQK